jgi:hypothetical protein
MTESHIDTPMPTAWYLTRYSATAYLREVSEGVWKVRIHIVLVRQQTADLFSLTNDTGYKGVRVPFRIGTITHRTAEGDVFVITNDRLLPLHAGTRLLTREQIIQHFTPLQSIDLETPTSPPLAVNMTPPWVLQDYDAGMELDEPTENQWEKRDHDRFTIERTEILKEDRYSPQAGKVARNIPFQLGEDGATRTVGDTLYCCTVDQIVCRPPLAKAVRTQSWERYGEREDFELEVD